MSLENYDAKLIPYQVAFEVVAQVMMYDLYSKLDQKALSSYAVMGLLNAGASLGTVELSKAVYRLFHDESERDLNTEYFVSPITKGVYDFNLKQSSSGKSKEILDTILRQAPAYSKTNMNLFYTSVAAKSTYGFLNAPPKMNSFLKALYGISQPLAVILKDNDQT